MTKSQAGALGQQALINKFPNRKEYLAWMQHLARRGASAFHAKYQLKPLGTNDFAIVSRETGLPTGKTINGLVLPTRSEL